MARSGQCQRGAGRFRVVAVSEPVGRNRIRAAAPVGGICELTVSSIVDDAGLAVAIAAGTLSALGQLLHDQPERDAAATADRMAEDLLRIYGVPAEEAREICLRPLPDLDAALPPDSAA